MTKFFKRNKKTADLTIISNGGDASSIGYIDGGHPSALEVYDDYDFKFLGLIVLDHNKGDYIRVRLNEKYSAKAFQEVKSMDSMVDIRFVEFKVETFSFMRGKKLHKKKTLLIGRDAWYELMCANYDYINQMMDISDIKRRRNEED